MNEAGKQHKKAWEYDAYNFWVEHNGTPEERAKADMENPKKMLRNKPLSIPIPSSSFICLIQGFPDHKEADH